MKEMFDKHHQKFIYDMLIAEVYHKKAKFYKRVYELTKFKWAKDKNQHYVDEGIKLLVGDLGIALVDMCILTDIVIRKGE